MDTQIIAFGMILVGAICGLVIPALIAMHERGEEFKLSYLYGLGLSVPVAAFAALPTDEISLTFRSLFMLFLAGVGLQGIVNKGNTMRIKAKKQ
jgi:O-antigen/teichoic acid export membrane protein